MALVYVLIMFDDADGCSHIEKVVSNPVAADHYVKTTYPQSKVTNWHVSDVEKDKFVCCFCINPKETIDYLRNYVVVERYEVCL